MTRWPRGAAQNRSPLEGWPPPTPRTCSCRAAWQSPASACASPCPWGPAPTSPAPRPRGCCSRSGLPHPWHRPRSSPGRTRWMCWRSQRTAAARCPRLEHTPLAATVVAKMVVEIRGSSTRDGSQDRRAPYRSWPCWLCASADSWSAPAELVHSCATWSHDLCCTYACASVGIRGAYRRWVVALVCLESRR